MCAWSVGQSTVACSSAATYLRAVGVEGGVLVVELDGLGVEVQCRGEVVVLEGLVAFVLELGSFLLRVAHVLGRRSGCGTPAGVCEHEAAVVESATATCTC